MRALIAIVILGLLLGAGAYYFTKPLRNREIDVSLASPTPKPSSSLGSIASINGQGKGGDNLPTSGPELFFLIPAGVSLAGLGYRRYRLSQRTREAARRIEVL